MADRTYPPGQQRRERATCAVVWLSFLAIYLALLAAWLHVAVPSSTPAPAVERLKN